MPSKLIDALDAKVERRSNSIAASVGIRFALAETFYKQGQKEKACDVYLEGLKILNTHGESIEAFRLLELCVLERALVTTYILPT